MRIIPVHYHPTLIPRKDWVKGSDSPAEAKTNITDPSTTTMNEPMTVPHNEVSHTEEPYTLELGTYGPNGYTCAQCGLDGWMNKHAMAMHVSRSHKPGLVLTPEQQIKRDKARAYARNRYLNEKEKIKAQRAARTGKQKNPAPRMVESHAPVARVDVGKISRYPKHCPECGEDLRPVIAAMNIVR